MKARDPRCNTRNIEPADQPKTDDRIISDITVTDFLQGELYLFHRTDPACPANDSLMGMIERRIGNTIYLRECTFDTVDFEEWYCLPAEYRYCRLSTRDELKRYLAALPERS